VAVTSRTRTRDTPHRALDAAERLVQTRGFNGFSYADVARELGITTASLHYHFPSKGELGQALIARYSARFMAALAAIDGEQVDARARLEAYVGVYRSVLQQGRMCLCGMLAAEFATLPLPMRDAVNDFLDANTAWLTGVLARGRADHTLTLAGSAADMSKVILDALEGALLIARSTGRTSHFDVSTRALLASLTAS
jgi:TetR/AcrR family transcriptional repressor of nem operon